MSDERFNFFHPLSLLVRLRLGPRYGLTGDRCLDGWRKSASRLSHEWKDAAAMPVRLRPTAPIAADAILVGDPGRSLLLAQELLEQPRMSNHARGLWGYSGRTPGGHELTIQATGIGGPSAAAVLADLVELGVRRAIRIGTCAGLDPEARAGDVLLVERALAAPGSAASFGLAPGEGVAPDAALLERLSGEPKAGARPATIASLDRLPGGQAPPGATAADMQTLALLARGRELGIAAAALLIVGEDAAGVTLSDEPLGALAERCGRAASAVLST
jgi:purine-nucleoside phosphorylase